MGAIARCPVCQEVIYKGELVIYSQAKNEFVHEDCWLPYTENVLSPTWVYAGQDPMIEQIEYHLNRLGLRDLGPVDSITVHGTDIPGEVRLADDHGEWIGSALLALKKLSAKETLSWKEFWELFHEDYQ